METRLSRQSPRSSSKGSEPRRQQLPSPKSEGGLSQVAPLEEVHISLADKGRLDGQEHTPVHTDRHSLLGQPTVSRVTHGHVHKPETLEPSCSAHTLKCTLAHTSSPSAHQILSGQDTCNPGTRCTTSSHIGSSHTQGLPQHVYIPEHICDR